MRQIQIATDGRDGVRCLRKLNFSADGKLLSGLCGELGQTPSVFRYDLMADQELELPETEDDYECEPIEGELDPCIHADGELIAEILVTSRGFRGLRLIDVWSKPVSVAWHGCEDSTAPFRSYTFSPDAELFWTLRWDEDERLDYISAWTVGELLAHESDIPHRSLVYENLDETEPGQSHAALATNTDGTRIAVMFNHGKLLIGDLTEPGPWIEAETVQRLNARGLPIKRRGLFNGTLLYHPHFEQLIAQDSRGLQLWNHQGARCGYYATNPNERLLSFASLPTANQFLLGLDTGQNYAKQGEIALIELGIGEVQARIDFGLGPVTGLAVGPDGLTAAAGFENGQIIVWDL